MASGFFIQVDDRAVARHFENLGHALAELGRMRLVVGSPVAYAYAIETGRTRGGRPARARGGAWMVRDGMRETRGQIPALMRRLLDRPGRGVGKQAEDAIRRTALGAIQSRTPVVSGRLRNSFVVRSLH